MQKIVLITGASSGIGKATALHLAKNGYKVYGAARRVSKMAELKPMGITPIGMDVTKEDSVKVAVDQILRESGRIDILINNAGFGSNGAIEDVSIEDAHYQLEVNVFGAMRLTQLLLPHMRKNKYGKIVNISSIGGKLAFPLAGWYHASKFALEALSDSLRMEVKHFGIDVIVIEPGGIQSEWADIAYGNMMKVSGNTAYKKMAENAHKMVSALQLPEPIVIAELIKKGIEAQQPKARYAGGFMVGTSLFMSRFLSDKLKDRLILSRLKG